MNILFYILLFNLIGSVISLVGGIILLSNRNIAYKFSHYLASFAAGALLGTAFFDLLPEAILESEELGMGSESIFAFTLGGILFFFILERLLHWFHHHGYEDHIIQGKPVIPLLIVGDTIHNIIDGMAIAATFLVSIPLGIVTTFAVGAHEIPQEIGDFGVMLKHKFSRKKIIFINIFSSLASFAGALITYYFGTKIEGISVILISISAGLFLYIALSDIIPEIHHENKKGLAIRETVSLLSGVIIVYIALYFISDVLKISH